MEKKKPKGIIILGTVCIIYAISHLYQFMDEFLNLGYRNFTALLFGLCLLVATIAVLKLKNWGRNFMIVIALYDFFNEVIVGIIGFNKKVSDLSTQFTNLPKQDLIIIAVFVGFVIALIDILIIVYLTRQRIKEQFR